MRGKFRIRGHKRQFFGLHGLDDVLHAVEVTPSWRQGLDQIAKGRQSGTILPGHVGFGPERGRLRRLDENMNWPGGECRRRRAKVQRTPVGRLKAQTQHLGVAVHVDLARRDLMEAWHCGGKDRPAIGNRHPAGMDPMMLENEHRVGRRPGLPDLHGLGCDLADARQRPEHRAPNLGLILLGHQPAYFRNRGAGTRKDGDGRIRIDPGAHGRGRLKLKSQRHGDAEGAKMVPLQGRRQFQLRGHLHGRPAPRNADGHPERSIAQGGKRGRTRDLDIHLVAGLFTHDRLRFHPGGDFPAAKGLQRSAVVPAYQQRGKQAAGLGRRANDPVPVPGGRHETVPRRVEEEDEVTACDSRAAGRLLEGDRVLSHRRDGEHGHQNQALQQAVHGGLLRSFQRPTRRDHDTQSTAVRHVVLDLDRLSLDRHIQHMIVQMNPRDRQPRPTARQTRRNRASLDRRLESQESIEHDLWNQNRLEELSVQAKTTWHIAAL